MAMNTEPPPSYPRFFGLIVHNQDWRGRWRGLTFVASAALSYYLVFHVKFPQEKNGEEKDHVFTSIRKKHNDFVKRMKDTFF